MVWDRLCRWPVISLLLGYVVLVEQAWGYHDTLRIGEWSLRTLIPMLTVLGALVGLGVFFAWPRRRRHASGEKVPPHRAKKPRPG